MTFRKRMWLNPIRTVVDAFVRFLEGKRDAATKWGLAWCASLGGAGLVVGFCGPLAIYPDSAQGPLFGLFITTPLGIVVGLVVCVLLSGYGSTRPRLLRAIMVSASVLYGLGILAWLLIGRTGN